MRGVTNSEGRTSINTWNVHCLIPVVRPEDHLALPCAPQDTRRQPRVIGSISLVWPVICFMRGHKKF